MQPEDSIDCDILYESVRPKITTHGKLVRSNVLSPDDTHVSMILHKLGLEELRNNTEGNDVNLSRLQAINHQKMSLGLDVSNIESLV